MAIQDNINSALATVGAAGFAMSNMEAHQLAKIKANEAMDIERVGIKGNLKQNEIDIALNKSNLETINQKNMQGDYSPEKYQEALMNNQKNLIGLQTQREQWNMRLAQITNDKYDFKDPFTRGMMTASTVLNGRKGE